MIGLGYVPEDERAEGYGSSRPETQLEELQRGAMRAMNKIKPIRRIYK